MMAQRGQVGMSRNRSLGDTAVDGLLSGMAAGLAMAAYLLVSGLLGGEGVAGVLGRFDLTVEQSPLTGGLLHLATSAIYGLVFALLLRFARGRRPDAPRAGWAFGIVYGLALFVLAWLWFVPAASPLRGLGAANFAAAHALYGAVLGYLVGRHARA